MNFNNLFWKLDKQMRFNNSSHTTKRFDYLNYKDIRNIDFDSYLRMSLSDRMVTDKYMKTSKILTDPDTRLEVFIKLWLHAMKTMSKESPTQDESEPVIYYMEEMVSLLIDEKCSEDKTGPIFKYSLDQDIFNKVYIWSSKCSGEILEKMKQQQLRLFAAIVSQGHPSVLHHRELLQPLLRLLNSYSIRSSHKLEISLVNLLKLISIQVANEPILQHLCTEIGITQLKDPLPLLNPLVPFLHRDGILGQEAKDAVLLILALSMNNEDVAISVALKSDFCPILATGLSALYSALPRKLPVFCHSVLLGQLGNPIVSQITELQHFLNYLHFCCQVNEVTHPLIREAVLHYIYNGFLLRVIGSSLNQSSLDEVIAATIYFDLFLRSITDSGILKAFLCFVVAESHDGYRILDSLINRMNSNTGLSVATLSLMNTLLSFNCEDIMFELIFKYLIPCQHISGRSRDSIIDKEILSVGCEMMHNLHFDFLDYQWQLDADLLETTKQQIDIRNQACESSWHFDYNGINPSCDYVEKVMDPNFLQNNKLFHGFLDHFSQLLDMRDIYKRNSINNGSLYNALGSSSPNSTTTFDMSGSFHFTPRSQLSRSNSMETVMSLKSEIDSQLDNCLHRLRFPSEEDLLEQRSKYMISYNIVSDFDTLSMNSYLNSKLTKNDANMKQSKGFNLTKESISQLVEISFEDLRSLSNCNQLDEFLVILDRIDISPEVMRLCDFSLDDVFDVTPLEKETEKNKTKEHHNTSPIGSIMSLQSAITMEENILKDNPESHVYIHSKASSGSDRKTATVGPFLYTILDRMETFQANPFQINIQLIALIVSLLSFPQPLLRNFLLDPSETFTNGLKSLYGVLRNLKEKIIEIKMTANIARGSDSFFQSLCADAKSRLDKRVALLEEGDYNCEEMLSICSCLQTTESDITIKGLSKSPKKNFNLMQFLIRKSNKTDNQTGYWNFNKKSNKEIEFTRQLNAAYSTIIFDHFIQEIVAFSQEHFVHFQSFSYNI